ncbi:MAG: ROK family protein [Verrucomicrobiota bacterium]|jgi:glucokinase
MDASAQRSERESYALGIDLGGSCVKAVAVEPGGATLGHWQETFDPARPRHFAEVVRALTQRIAAERGTPPANLGLSAPGLAAADGRSITCMPGRLEGLEGLDWQTFLGLPCPMPVLNDAHAALLGEVWQGAAVGARNVILLTLGTGVGGAAMVDGHLLRGAIGRAGHLGHICVDLDAPADVSNTPGSLEYQIGNYSLAGRSAGRFTTTEDLVRAHLAGDGFASGVWLKSVRALAAGIASFINILDPETVIIGGGMARAGDTLFEPLSRFLDDYEWRPGGHRARTVPARLGEFAGAMGAAARALDLF